jgi:hypothetical protein
MVTLNTYLDITMIFIQRWSFPSWEIDPKNVSAFMKPWTLGSAFMLLLVHAAFAQTPTTHTDQCLQDRVKCAYDKPLQRLASAFSKEPTSAAEQTEQSDALKEIVSVTTPEHFIFALTGQYQDDVLLTSVLSAWERSRVDKQIGTNSASRGTTDLVSRPSTSELLGLAMQAGALTETVSGSVATFQANAEGTYHAIVGQPTVCQDCLKPWSLNNLNFYVSFDLASQGSKTISTSGSATSSFTAPSAVVLPQSSAQFSSLDVKYTLRNPIDPRSSKFQSAWKRAYKNHYAELASEAVTLDAALAAILQPLVADTKFVDLQKEYLNKFKAAAPGGMNQLLPLLRNFVGQAAALARADVPNLDDRVAQAVASYARYSQINYDAVSEAAGSQWTAEYIFNHPTTQPDTHDFRLIYSLTPKHDPKVPAALFTINLAGSIYGGTIPVGAKYGRFRDFQFAAQLDRPLGDAIAHPATLTVAGYVQYQFDPSVINIGPGNLVPGTSITLPSNAQVLLGTKGTLGIVQGKITINSKAGINIPIGVSWANKTNLLNATDVRGNIGITYDFNSFGQLFGR